MVARNGGGDGEELREFMLMLRMALLHIVGYIERKYGLVRRDK